MTEEINKLEETVGKAENAKKAAIAHSNKLYLENSALKTNQNELFNWLKVNAPGLQIPSELVDLPVATLMPTATAPHDPDLVSSESASPLVVPATPSNPVVHHQSQPHTVQEHSSIEVQHRNTQLEMKIQQATNTISALSKEMAWLKKNAKASRALSKTKLRAEVAELHERVGKLRTTTDVAYDALAEFARIERYLTAMVLKYESFVKHLEEEWGLKDVVAAAEKWIAIPQYHVKPASVNGGIASAAYQGAHGDSKVASCPESAEMPSALDPRLASSDTRHNSPITADSGFAEGTSMPSLSMATLDGYTSPQDLFHASHKRGIDLTQVSIFDDNAVAAVPAQPNKYNSNIIADTHAALHNLADTGKNHHDNNGMLTAIGSGFDNIHQASSAANANYVASPAHNPLFDISALSSGNTSAVAGPQLHAVQASSCLQSTSTSQSVLNPVSFQDKSYLHDADLPSMAGSSEAWAEMLGDQNDPFWAALNDLDENQGMQNDFNPSPLTNEQSFATLYESASDRGAGTGVSHYPNPSSY